jgi:hypothetical protein
LRIGLVACVSVSSAFAGEKGESNQRYIVLATGRTKTIKQELADAATKGYHIVAGDAANNILLLEKGQTRPAVTTSISITCSVA